MGHERRSNLEIATIAGFRVRSLTFLFYIGIAIARVGGPQAAVYVIVELNAVYRVDVIRTRPKRQGVTE